MPVTIQERSINVFPDIRDVRDDYLANNVPVAGDSKEKYIRISLSRECGFDINQSQSNSQILYSNGAFAKAETKSDFFGSQQWAILAVCGLGSMALLTLGSLAGVMLAGCFIVLNLTLLRTPDSKHQAFIAEYQKKLDLQEFPDVCLASSSQPPTVRLAFPNQTPEAKLQESQERIAKRNIQHCIRVLKNWRRDIEENFYVALDEPMQAQLTDIFQRIDTLENQSETNVFQQYDSFKKLISSAAQLCKNSSGHVPDIMKNKAWRNEEQHIRLEQLRALERASDSV